MNISFFCCKYVSGLKVFSCSSSYEMPSFLKSWCFVAAGWPNCVIVYFRQFCWAKLNQRTLLSTPPPKFGNDCKHLRESKHMRSDVRARSLKCLHLYQSKRRWHNFTPFTTLQFYNFLASLNYRAIACSCFYYR
jgi:hypothetical protein